MFEMSGLIEGLGILSVKLWRIGCQSAETWRLCGGNVEAERLGENVSDRT